jgi:hypothetical protein
LLNDNDYNYLLRCIDRIKNLFNNYNNVIFVMIQPLYILNNDVNMDKIINLFDILKKYFNNNQFKLLIFNITKISNNLFKEIKLNDKLFVYELETNMIKGNYGMMYFDDSGTKNFLEILKIHD